jgi:hypothetical protein
MTMYLFSDRLIQCWRTGLYIHSTVSDKGHLAQVGI